MLKYRLKVEKNVKNRKVKRDKCISPCGIWHVHLLLLETIHVVLVLSPELLIHPLSVNSFFLCRGLRVLFWFRSPLILFFFFFPLILLFCTFSPLIFRVSSMKTLSHTHPAPTSFIMFSYRVRYCCCLAVQSSPTLCDPMDCSMSGFLVLHYLPEFAKTHVYWIGDAIQHFHPLLPLSPPSLHLAQHQGLFPMTWLFTSGGQSIGASALAYVLPMNI